jgi:quercetin dioxygenase-like cupin family protein/DNA-binding Xre family transcriptional regulator
MNEMKSPNDLEFNVGERIREIRTKLGLSIRGLAAKVGISYLTMQRIETDKLSPSVVLLAQISACLNYPIADFLLEKEQSVIYIKAENQNILKTKKMELTVVARKGIVNENISIVRGKAKKGQLVGRHTHPGFELAYVLKGRSLHKQGGVTRELKEGDLIFFDASKWHEVIALEPHEWIGMQFYADTINLGTTEDTTPEGEK